jgi:hypothetical protein
MTAHLALVLELSIGYGDRAGDMKDRLSGRSDEVNN